MTELTELRRAAREIFGEALARTDAGRAVRGAVRLEGERLTVVDAEFDLGATGARVYSVALGKAAHAMASALDSVLGERLAGGVMSAPRTEPRLERWLSFVGGHPVPNGESLEAARAAFGLLEKANRESALVVFLISGGGSAMLEWPGDESLTLEDLRAANRALVNCGASIAEVNAVRRRLSAVKGGRLSARAPRAAQVSLIVSDVNAGEEANVASGPTFPPPPGEPEAGQIVARYHLVESLPARVVRALRTQRAREEMTGQSSATRRHHVLLDNARAVEYAAEAARARGFAVEVAADIVEQDADEGARALVSRVVELHRREGAGGKVVCLISGGEFACPVRGAGVGGRNSETALRCAVEMNEWAGASDERAVIDSRASLPAHVVALSAGTDGVDGNSPAAGALADTTTMRRARELGMGARKFLDQSDAHTFFDALGDALVTGPTGTNVRDLRVLLAGAQG